MQKPWARGEVYNIAGGKDYSILELVAILNKLTKKELRPKLFAPRAGDVFRTWADLSKAKKELGYRPQVDFTRGLKITKEYFEKNA
jgi:nucleoside-diphosphate-sugar epimerase